MQAVLEERWLDRPLAASLLQANALPSLAGHSAWLSRWAGLPEASWQGLVDGLKQVWLAHGQTDAARGLLHRHVSTALLADPDLQLGWIPDWEDAALPLCLAPEGLWQALVRYAGLMIVGPGIRQIIVRSDLALILERLGAPALDFVRHVAPAIWPGAPDAPRTLPAECDTQVARAGEALVRCALQAATAPVAQRIRLRLPPEGDSLDLPASLADPPQALGRCRDILNLLDSAWLSHFPALR